MICLGMEGTAHTFAVGIVGSKKNILADKRDMFMTEKGGMIPNEVSKHHREVNERVLKETLEEAKLKMEDVDLIAFSSSPGLAPCLITVRDFVKELKKRYKKKIIGVNHCIAHLSSGDLFCKVRDPVYVFTSGANTQIIAFEGGKYRIFGETLDIGLGNALDKFGRAIGLGFPSGPEIEKLALNGKYIELPYVVKGMDLSFSGIVTRAINLFNEGYNKEDLCYSIQETFFSMLVEVTERALAHTNKEEALLIGGVGANKRLCKMMNVMCKERNARFFNVPLKYAGDQGVMIAWQGILEKDKEESFDIDPSLRVDEVDINWK